MHLQGWPIAKVSSCSRIALSDRQLQPSWYRQTQNQTWWKPPFSNKIPLTQPISHVSFRHSNPLAAGPNLHRKREHDHVRGPTDGRHKPDHWDKVIDKFTPKEFLDPIGTKASIWAPFFAEVQSHRASKSSAQTLTLTLSTVQTVTFDSASSN